MSRLDCVDVSDTLPAINKFLEDAVSELPDERKVREVHFPGIFGFFMGFRKDQNILTYRNNILLKGAINSHQGTMMLIGLRK
jgi:hypothetical protein